MTCHACGFPTIAKLCHFCRRTVDLVNAGLCVSCTAPLDQLDTLRQEGRCAACRGRRVTGCAGTRRILKLAAKARYRAAA